MISTKSALLISILLALCCLSFADSTDSKTRKPNLVIEIFRHGARGALVADYDPNNHWRNKLGELTSSGMRMHYLLGSALGKIYPDLLKSYDPVNIYIRSTDVNRTIMSAYSQLSGVFEGTGPKLKSESAQLAFPAYQHSSIQEKAKQLDNSYALPNNLQAVPIHVVPKPDDYLMRPFDCCSKQSKWVAQNAADDVTTSIFNNEMKDVVSHLKTQGYSIPSMSKLSYFGDTCITNKFEGLELPGGITVDHQRFKDLKFASEYMTVKNNEGNMQQRTLYAVPLLNEIKGFIDNAKSKPDSSPKFAFLSAHDTTLMTLLAAFNITTPECLLENYRSEKAGKALPYPNCVFPQYASNLIFEYYANNDSINFYYNGQDVPFCHKEGNQCSYAEFKTYIGDVTNHTNLESFKKICGITKEDPNNGKKNTSGLSTLEAFLIPLCSVLFMSLVGTCILFRKKQYARLKRTASAESLLTDI